MVQQHKFKCMKITGAIIFLIAILITGLPSLSIAQANQPPVLNASAHRRLTKALT